MLTKRIGLALVGLLACASVAFAQQGAFPNYPIVGGAAYCSSTNNGVCTNTVPAGPSVLTGSEQLPANTELPNGRSPQNVLITPASFNSLPVTFQNYTGGTTGTTAVLISGSNLSGGVVIISGATITLAQVSLPSAPIQGQEYLIDANQTLTGLRVAATPGSGHTVSNAPTVLTVSTTGSFGYKFKYNSATTTWYRVQ